MAITINMIAVLGSGLDFQIVFFNNNCSTVQITQGFLRYFFIACVLNYGFIA